MSERIRRDRRGFSREYSNLNSGEFSYRCKCVYTSGGNTLKVET